MFGKKVARSKNVKHVTSVKVSCVKCRRVSKRILAPKYFVYHAHIFKFFQRNHDDRTWL